MKKSEYFLEVVINKKIITKGGSKMRRPMTKKEIKERMFNAYNKKGELTTNFDEIESLVIVVDMVNGFVKEGPMADMPTSLQTDLLLPKSSNPGKERMLYWNGMQYLQ